MEGSYSTDQSPQWAVVPVEEEGEVNRTRNNVLSQDVFCESADVSW
jgi:hypothetical protein